MAKDDDKHGGHFDASMPLPTDDYRKTDDSAKHAADIVRKKVEAAYKTEPKAAAEAADTFFVGGDSRVSPHQKYLMELTGSGKPLAEIQAAWHEYYAGLPDAQKHEVWQEFYSSHAQASHYAAAMPQMIVGRMDYEETTGSKHKAAKPRRAAKKTYDRQSSASASLGPAQHLQSLLFGLGVGAVVVIIFLFSFFNERFIAPLIQPSRSVTNTPIITENAISNPNPEIVIPKINVELPVVYGMDSIEEGDVQKALENGVLHYADTALPGQNGNVVIIGHSAVNLFVSGHYKFAFTLLKKLDDGDTMYLDKDGKRYTYQIYKKEIVKPTDIGVLGPAEKPATVTLITCDPPGLNVNRLVVVAEQISPDPTRNIATNYNRNSVATQASIVPGNSPSLWSKMWGWFSH
jgi:LPXTG-site transpeptidase (sortase) family protein